ncbi:hypothetical protein FJZ31_19570 [Candidatus Poribacteria bacterium]|nr:hypothetical protein [Candidatus Poribacteria bacterium]
MAHAYTPGLKVTTGTTIRKERRLPLNGEILVQLGEHVKAETVVAKAELPGNVQLVNVANHLSITPQDIHSYMLKQQGEHIAKDEIIASTKGIFGLFKSQSRAPTDGIIESISEITGQIAIREKPIPVEINAYVDGKVVEILSAEGVVVETYATFIQGIFGIGGEVIGELTIAVQGPDDILTANLIDQKFSDKIIVGGSKVTSDALKKAVSSGLKGIIVGGIDDSDVRDFLGYELGVAITGSERLGITLIITEGFGRIRMANQTFELLKQRAGLKTSINGATQIRAGVVRPEIVIPLEKPTSVEAIDEKISYMDIGTSVRIIREPYFGKLGWVTDLPVELQSLETEAKVRVLEVELEDGQKVILPRANVEIIEV